MTTSSDFQKQWGVPWEVKKTIPEASFYEIESTARKFSSGRAVIDVVFYDADRIEICRRTGMSLTSKAGRPYEVCHRDPERTAAPQPQRESFSAADVFGE